MIDLHHGCSEALIGVLRGIQQPDGSQALVLPCIPRGDESQAGPNRTRLTTSDMSGAELAGLAIALAGVALQLNTARITVKDAPEDWLRSRKAMDLAASGSRLTVAS